MSESRYEQFDVLRFQRGHTVTVVWRDDLPDRATFESGIPWTRVLRDVALPDKGQDGERTKYVCIGHLSDFLPTGKDYTVSEILTADVLLSDIELDLHWLAIARQEAARIGCKLSIESTTWPFSLWAEFPVWQVVVTDVANLMVVIQDPNAPTWDGFEAQQDAPDEYCAGSPGISCPGARGVQEEDMPF